MNSDLAMLHNFTVYRGSDDGNIVQDTTSKAIRPKEVLIRTTHSGVCASDEVSLHPK